LLLVLLPILANDFRSLILSMLSNSLISQT
jgi:hypothetical protein